LDPIHKDDTGWPKALSNEDEEAYVRGLVPEERHTVSGLGGSQKAEVAWLDKHGIPYKEVDVSDFITNGKRAKAYQPRNSIIVSAKSSSKIVPINPTQNGEEMVVREEEKEEEGEEEEEDEEGGERAGDDDL
jgi:hypothetical protein